MTQQMQGEEFQRMLTNPDALSAMMQIQQGMMRLQATSPGTLAQGGGYAIIYIFLPLKLCQCVFL